MGPDDLDRVNDMLQRYKGDPWERTQQELQFTLNKSKQETPDQAQGYVISRRQFERWWSLITDPAHVNSEVEEMPKAWEGAIEFQRNPPFKTKR